MSRYGYAVLDLTADSATVTFKDVAGGELFQWTRVRGDLGGGTAPAPIRPLRNSDGLSRF